MKQYEAVKKVMEQNGGFATLGHLNQKVLQVPGFKWKAQEPFANIRRIVQDKRFFFNIKPGLWALLSHKDTLPQDVFPTGQVSKSKREIDTHSYYQGLLVEIGCLKRYITFVPNQDKNRPFLGRPLREVSSKVDFYQFGDDRVVRKAKTIDVCWFNDRKMPSVFFEVEHSTNFHNSLLKFVELQDYNMRFYIVADKARKAEYDGKLVLSAFKPIQQRVTFVNYEDVLEWHSKISELRVIEERINF